MTIKIFTYEDPYKLDEEEYWGLISESPWICASQVMVNAFQTLFSSVRDKNLYSTTEKLCQNFYPEWLDPMTTLMLYSSIDSQIRRSMDSVIGGDINLIDSAESSFRKNQKQVLQSIRTLFDFEYSTDNEPSEDLPIDQKILFDLYIKIKLSGKFSNVLPGNVSERIIQDRLAREFEASKNQNRQVGSGGYDRIVFIGVHQFTPILARLFIELSNHMEIIVLYNYRSDYPQVYKTWSSVYSPLNAVTHHSNKPYELSTPNESVQLAKNLLQIFEGRRIDFSNSNHISVIEFDTEADFADYVAQSFQSAKRTASAKNINNPLSVMKEKFYSASTHVNEILKTYFPDQFEERSFLDYPIGKFVYGLTRIWNSDLNKVEITDWDHIREILASRIIDIDHQKSLLTIFNRIFPYIESATNFEEIMSRLEDLEDILDSSHRFNGQICYLNSSVEEVEELIVGFQNLQDISTQFFLDFQNNRSNFRRFYRELNNFIEQKFSNDSVLEYEFSEYLKRVRHRFQKINNLDTHGSFKCLQSTINEYLQIDETEQSRSKWIVKGFKQIDGDILINSGKNKDTIYHFACLSDENVVNPIQSVFPWPLTETFFSYQRNSKFKIAAELYISSMKERENYNRYALIFGLIFNPGKMQISYVKQTSNKSNGLYYPLLLLPANIQPWRNNIFSSRISKTEYDFSSTPCDYSFSESDLYLYKTCQFRFLIESLIKNRTEYSDSYLIRKYIESFLENKVRQDREGDRLWSDSLYKELDDHLEDLMDELPVLKHSERLDMVRNVFNKLKQLPIFPHWTVQEEKASLQRVLFLSNFDKKSIQNLINDGTPLSDCLTEENLGDFRKYNKEQSVACNLCPIQSICLHRRIVD
ncbi:hypothetical protein [Ileibacterium valens]|uniref:hypothetical protein n=1 Tax=Ileibacterium valens TaxID=1862668 RepID=UPI0024BADEBE|nr:hypothetical protein [Ileibacterium valens]